MNSKIQRSIELIQKAEPLALQYQEYGLHVAFSGGKDSMVIYHLCKMAGVKFKAFMNVTTIDPPELMKFVRGNYPDVVLLRPIMNFYDLIIKNKALPTRTDRFCCRILKESGGENTVTTLGIRKQESLQRSGRQQLEVSKRKYSNTLDQFNIDTENNLICINGKDKIMLSPILDWTTSDVWRFIRENKLKYCSLYDRSYRRIGCIFCPMAGRREKQIHLRDYPLFARNVKKSIAVIMQMGKYSEFESPDDVFNWWISGKSVKEYMAFKNQTKLDL